MSLRLMVAVPSHSGTVVLETARALLALQELILERSGSMTFHDHCGPDINLSRNLIASHFMDSEAEILVMLDSDTGVQKETFRRMIDLDQPFVGCIYPKRLYNWQKADLARASDIRDILRQASEFVGLLEGDATGTVNIRNGFALAERVGAGVTLYRRQAFERLMEAYPELEGCGFEPAAFPKHKFNWGFFNSVIRNGIPISEDYSFCLRWRECGGEIWADVASPVQHIGRHQFAGSYLDFLRNRLKSG